MINEVLSHHILDHVLRFSVLGHSFGITLHTVYMAGISLLLLLLLPLAARLGGGRVRTLAEGFVIFVRDEIVLPNMGEGSQKFVPFFCTMFIFLIFANYLGLVPGAATITANISVTAGMAVISGCLIVLTSIKENGLGGFIKTFIPGGVPWPLAILIFPLEVASLFVRVFVLAIRLFANMVAGHMVLLGLFCFIFIMGAKGAAIGFGAAAPVLGMTLFVTTLELLVAGIQAYVFVLLTAIFTGLQMHAH